MDWQRMIGVVHDQNTREQGSKEDLRCWPYWSIGSDQKISEEILEDQSTNIFALLLYKQTEG
jgi:hypothetical protein